MKDYIERDTVAEDIAEIDVWKYMQEWGKSMWTCAVLQLHKDIVEYLVNFPAADVRPVVRGHFGKPTSPFTAPCSECGASMNTHWNYCPNCGADMVTNRNQLEEDE